jgi:hypothetical protein
MGLPIGDCQLSIRAYLWIRTSYDAGPKNGCLAYFSFQLPGI